jgi:hypothetical protein
MGSRIYRTIGRSKLLPIHPSTHPPIYPFPRSTAVAAVDWAEPAPADAPDYPVPAAAEASE